MQEINWKKKVFLLDDLLVEKATGKGLAKTSERMYFKFEGEQWNTRRVAFFLIHNRWPRGHFLLPWESEDPHTRR